MHIVIIASAPTFGGGEQYLWDIASGLVGEGHAVTVAVNRTLATEFRRRGVNVRILRIGQKLSRKNALQILLFPVWLFYLIIWLVVQHFSKPIDVIHCQYKKEQVLVSLAARCLHLRLVWTEHGPLPGFVATKPWLVAAYRRLSVLPERIIAVSEATRQDLIAHGVDGDKIITIYNGVVIEPLVAERQSPGAGRILSIGRLIPGKGHRLLIHAMPEILAKVPEASLVIAGDGPLAADLRSLIVKMELEHRVTLLGHVDRDTVRWQIEASSVVVMPSVPQVGGEGLPYAIVEAMERARPVVATRTGGIPELVEDGKTGVLVDSCTSKAFAAAISSLLKHPLQAEALSRNARSTAERRFSLSAMIHATEKVLAASVARCSPS